MSHILICPSPLAVSMCEEGDRKTAVSTAPWCMMVAMWSSRVGPGFRRWKYNLLGLCWAKIVAFFRTEDSCDSPKARNEKMQSKHTYTTYNSIHLKWKFPYPIGQCRLVLQSWPVRQWSGRKLQSRPTLPWILRPVQQWDTYVKRKIPTTCIYGLK